MTPDLSMPKDPKALYTDRFSKGLSMSYGDMLSTSIPLNSRGNCRCSIPTRRHSALLRIMARI